MPHRDPPVSGIGADDRVNVSIEDGQALRVPVEGVPITGARRRPSLIVRWAGAETCCDRIEFRSVPRDAQLSKSGRVCDRVDREVVTFVLELEFDHPVDQLGGGRTGYFRHPGVKVQQIAAGVTDDSAGVIGAHDYPERRRDRLLSYGEHNGRVFGFGGFA